jgi:hypothetical protein
MSNSTSQTDTNTDDVSAIYISNLIGIYTRILQSGSYLNSKEEDAVIINEILVRAASYPEFRNQLIRQPSNVLAQYDISEEAKSIIENSINDLTQ